MGQRKQGLYLRNRDVHGGEFTQMSIRSGGPTTPVDVTVAQRMRTGHPLTLERGPVGGVSHEGYLS